MDLFDQLRRFDILSHLDGEHLDLLAQCTGRIGYLDGDKVVEESSQSRDFHFVDHGGVKIQRTTPYGDYVLARLGVGEVFGEISFIDSGPRSGDVVADGESAILTIRANDLDAQLEANSRFAMVLYWSLWKALSQKLRGSNEVVARFFDESREVSPSGRVEPKESGDFKIGVHAKRDLFSEQTLSPMEINFLATLSKEKMYDPGEYIFRDGEEGDHLYIVLDGRVMIAKDVAGAGEEALAFLGRGEYFGEMALIDRQPRSASAKAHEEGAVVLTISREVLEGILDIQKVSSLRLLKLLCGLIAKRLREIDDKLVSWYIFDTAGSGGSLGVPG